MKHTRFFTVFSFAFAALILAASLPLLFAVHPILQWYFSDYLSMPDHDFTDLLIAFYIAYPICFAAVAMLMKILWNIAHDRLFVPANTRLFRAVSYLCLALAVLCFGFGMRYLSLFLLGLGLVFIGFLLQVLVQLFAKDNEISDENDLTI